MRRFILSAVVAAAALVLQLTTINGLRLPGGAVPDLVLLVVAALGLAGGPVPGAITGFAAGLCLDLAPPGTGVLGEYALVFCLVGWVCGRFRGTVARSAAMPILIAAATAAAGEVMIAALGLALQPAQVSWTSVRQVLPAAVFYDIAVSPFVLYLVLLAGAWLGEAGTADPGARAGQGRSPVGGGLVGPQGLGGPAALAGTQGLAPRQGLAGPAVSAGGAMQLGLGGWLAGPPESRRARRAAARRAPKLAPGSGRPGDGWVGDSAAGRARGSQAPGGPALSGQAWRGQALRGQAFSSQALRNLARDSRPHGSVSALRAGVAGSAAGGHAPRTLAARPVHLRLAGGRKGDGTVGNLLGGGRSVVAGRVPRGRSLSRRSMARLGRRRSGRGGGFRPTVMPGGSAVTSAVARRPAGRQLAPAAPIRFGSVRSSPGRFSPGRFPAGRRRDGLIGGGALTQLGRTSRLGRTGRRTAVPRFRGRPGGAVRTTASALPSAGGPGPAALHSLRRQAPQRRLRMRPRRGDGMLGGGRTTAGLRGGGARPATPRFRARPLGPARPPSGKRPKFGYRRWSVLSWLPGRLGARSPGRRTISIRGGSSRAHSRWARARWAAIRRTGGLG